MQEDATALLAAKQLIDGYDVELWDGGRSSLVARLDHVDGNPSEDFSRLTEMPEVAQGDCRTARQRRRQGNSRSGLFTRNTSLYSPSRSGFSRNILDIYFWMEMFRETHVLVWTCFFKPSQCVELRYLAPRGDWDRFLIQGGAASNSYFCVCDDRSVALHASARA